MAGCRARPERGRLTVAVYLIRAGHSGPCKIGRAEDPRDRLSDLQVAHYEQLRLLRMWEGGAAEEAGLHVRFADLHLRGEWHSYSRLMLGDVGLVQIYPDPTPPPPVDKGPWTINSVVQALGGRQVVAAETGVAANSITYWERRGRIPSEYWPDLLRLAAEVEQPEINAPLLMALYSTRPSRVA